MNFSSIGSWNETASASAHLRLPFKLPRDKIIHASTFNNIPISTLTREIGKSAGMFVIVDKSVDGKRVSGTFTDTLESEILARILYENDLQIDVITDNLILIQAKDAEHSKYPTSVTPYDLLPEQVSENSKAEIRSIDFDAKKSVQNNRFVPAPPAIPPYVDDIPPPPRYP